MRHRRAERCVLRAEEALAAGFDEDARQALEEARALAPSDTPDFEELKARVVTRFSAPAPEIHPEPELHEREIHEEVPEIEAALEEQDEPRSAGSNRRVWAMAAVVTLAVAGVIGYGLFGMSPRDPEAMQVVAGPAVASANNPAPPPPPAVLIDQMTVEAEPVRSQPLEGPLVDAGAVRASLPQRDPSDETRAAEPPPVLPTGASATLLEPPASASAVPVVLPRSVPTPIEPVSATLPEPPPAAPSADAGPTAPPAPPPAEPRIRAVLSSYEAAFGALDAGAVRSVWPTVDVRALSRAFDGLSSQSVSLGNCSIDVRGASATARCQGAAQWTPKVGGGSRTSPRAWEFSLQNAGDDWRIVSAVVR